MLICAIVRWEIMDDADGLAAAARAASFAIAGICRRPLVKTDANCQQSVRAPGRGRTIRGAAPEARGL